MDLLFLQLAMHGLQMLSMRLLFGRLRGIGQSLMVSVPVGVSVNRAREVRLMVLKETSLVMVLVELNVMLVEVFLQGLHLDHEVTTVRVYVSRIENAASCLERPNILLPSVLVKLFKVISPFELELVLVMIVAVDLNIIVEDVPRHIFWGQIFTPSMESWCPEVHLQALRLVHILDCLLIVGVHAANLVTIQRESDVFRGPLDLVSVPFTTDAIAIVAPILMTLNFLVAIAIDGVRRERIALRWYHVDVDLVPTTRVETRAIPVRVE